MSKKMLGDIMREAQKLQTKMAEMQEEAKKKKPKNVSLYVMGEYDILNDLTNDGAKRLRDNKDKSDLDLLFLYPHKVDRYVEVVTESILYPLWDLGLDVGHSVRSVRRT